MLKIDMWISLNIIQRNSNCIVKFNLVALKGQIQGLLVFQVFIGREREYTFLLNINRKISRIQLYPVTNQNQEGTGAPWSLD